MVVESECIICLEPPLPQNPIFLLACGCKVGWFHDSCKNRWIDFQTDFDVLRCPACRRPVPMKINYCFDWRAGPEQYYLSTTSVLLGCEVILSCSLVFSGVQYAGFIPLQSVLIFCLPFMFPNKNSIFFYLNHIRARAAYYGLYILFHMFILHISVHEKPWRTYYHILFPGLFQCVLLLLTHCQNPPYPYRNPLFPFAISREVILVATQSAPLATERNE
jgi:hypothetical protein